MPNLTYRDHCKIVAIDGKEAFTGGINIGEEYTGLKPNVGFWRDTHMRIAGEVAEDLQAIFDVHWNIASPDRMKARTRGNSKAEDTRTPIQGSGRKSLHIATGRAALSGWSAELGTELGRMDGAMDGTSDDTVPSAEALQKAYVQTLEGNPGIPTQGIREAYFICLTQATQTIDITNDLRSYRLNYEVCEIVYSEDVARQLTEQFERDLTDSVPLRMEELLQRPLSQRMIDQGARLFSPLL
ncbi:hypothetical protein skT53_25720 [Effusibacillus dendaii]|uniref:PLD phosphodiesterase domain-containing protein n=2 Tax=Effusibacillus dendaii TaxID=2743772 RepID=A0A7I8DC45_9BACL|nr:hypothetical protein skT53_25720 [Effusibacillus dendaii]